MKMHSIFLSAYQKQLPGLTHLDHQGARQPFLAKGENTQNHILPSSQVLPVKPHGLPTPHYPTPTPHNKHFKGLYFYA